MSYVCVHTSRSLTFRFLVIFTDEKKRKFQHSGIMYQACRIIIERHQSSQAISFVDRNFRANKLRVMRNEKETNGEC